MIYFLTLLGYANSWIGPMPPIVLKVLWHLRHPTSDEEFEELLLRVSHIHLVTMQTFEPKDPRLQLDLPDEQYQHLIRQWHDGIADDEGVKYLTTEPYRFNRGLLTARPTDFKVVPDYFVNIEAMVTAKEQVTGRRIPRIDGVLYPFTHGPQPHHHTRKALINQFTMRMHRMNTVCGRHHIPEVDVSAFDYRFVR